MVAAIAEIARSLKLDTVAEFVTRKQSVELLRAIGIGCTRPIRWQPA